MALYKICIAKESKSSSKFQSAIHAISWAHKLAGFKDLCISTLVQLTKEGAIRYTSKPVVKKEPITPDHLKLLVQGYRSDNLFNMRTLSIGLLGFAGYLRYSELANIKLCDILFEDTHMSANFHCTHICCTGHLHVQWAYKSLEDSASKFSFGAIVLGSVFQKRITHGSVLMIIFFHTYIN